MGLGKFSSAPIDESVGLLNLVNEDVLKDLKIEYPDYSSILELGVIAGENEINNEELLLRVKVSKLALQETLKQTKEVYLPYYRSKLKRLQKIEFWSQIFVVVTSSTAIISIMKELTYGAYIGAGLSLIAAILTLVVKRDSGEWSANNKNLANAFNELVVKRIKAEEIIEELKIQSQFIDDNTVSLSELVSDSNDLNRQIRTIIESNPSIA